jgi:hypothetical protein
VRIPARAWQDASIVKPPRPKGATSLPKLAKSFGPGSHQGKLAHGFTPGAHPTAANPQCQTASTTTTIGLRHAIVPVHRGFEGLASSAGDRWNQYPPLDRTDDCRDEYIGLLTTLLHRAIRQLRAQELPSPYVGSARAAIQDAAVLWHRGTGPLAVQSNSAIHAIFSSCAHGSAMCSGATSAIAPRFSSGRTKPE